MWNAAHVGMDRAAIHSAVGAPIGGDYQEKQMEMWLCDSLLLYRTLVVRYSDLSRPATATDVSVISRWRFGTPLVERLEQSTAK